MSSDNGSKDHLLDRRDQEVLRAASPAIGASSGSPRRRWSPRGSAWGSPRGSPHGNGGSNSGSPSKWSPSRWSPSKLSPSKKSNSYTELKDSNMQGPEEEGIEVNENSVPVPSLNISGASLTLNHGYISPTSPMRRELPSPTAKPRFAVPTLRQRGLGIQPLSPSKVAQNSNRISSPPKQPSPIFRFRMQDTMTGNNRSVGPIMPAAHVQSSRDETRDEDDDFDNLVKQRQESVKDTMAKERQEFPNTTLPSPPPGIQSARHLHELCASISTLDDLFRAQTFLKGHPEQASKVDMQGRTALHIFSSNKILATAIGVPDEIDFETQEFLRIYEQPTNDPETNQLKKYVLRFLGDLVAAHPGAMMMRDDHGVIPFEKSLDEWVKESHQRGISNGALGVSNNNTFSYTSAMSTMWESTVKIAERTSQFVASGFSATTESPTRGANAMERGDSRSAIFSPDRRKQFAGTNTSGENSGDSRNGDFPAFVRLTPPARFALTMLSAALEQLDRYLSPELLRRSRARPDANGENFIKAHEGLKEFQRQYGSVNIVASVVDTVAAIPDLMNTILLIDSDADREYALSTSVVRRMMLSTKSVGPWLTKILQSRDRALAQRAVDYLKTVSDEIAKQKPIGKGKSTENQDISQTEHYLVDEISRLKEFVPSLLALSERGIEDASTTSIVKNVMRRMISRPFAVTVILCDALFLAILIIGFRYAVNQLIAGASPATVLHWIYVANTGIFYFIIREIGKTVSLFLISTRARSYFLSFWNLIDAIAVMLALASTILMRYYFTILDGGINDMEFLRGFLAITTGFLWLRVLSLLKAINMQLATFVLAILQITKDILWFCVILATLVVSFSQMFFTLLAPPTCASSNAGSDKMCRPTEFLFLTYTILLGNFGNFGGGQFDTGFSVFLVVCYSFLITVVLLNILIAVASDSYEKCLLRSQHLFGRARVMLIAELVAFENLLQTTEYDQSSKAKQGIYSRWRSSSRWIRHWSRASILFFTLSVLVIVAWTIAELLGYAKGERNSNILFSLASVMVNVGLFAVIMLFLAAASANRSSMESRQAKGGLLRESMLRLLGVNHHHDPSKRNDTEEWNGRANYLEREMKRIADDQRVLAGQQAKAMETLVGQTEIRLKAELENLEDNFIILRESLLHEVKGTKRTNQFVTIAVQELKTMLVSASTTYRTPVPSEVNVDRTRTVYTEDRDL